MGPTVALLAGGAGLAVGSFVNTFIDRWPREEPVTAPPSRCEHCGRRLRPLELIPVLSWIVLRGRCRTCHAPIGWQAPLVEAATGLLWAAVAVHARSPAELLLGLGFTAVLVAVTGVDLKCQLIPNVALLAGLAWAGLVGLALAGVLGAGEPGAGELGPWTGRLLAALAGGAVFQVLRWASRGGLGFGDVKLAAWLGLYLGPRALPVTLFAAAIAGGVMATALLATGRRGRRDVIPFGPFLALGGLVGWFAGEAVLDAYLRWGAG